MSNIRKYLFVFIVGNGIVFFRIGQKIENISLQKNISWKA